MDFVKPAAHTVAHRLFAAGLLCLGIAAAGYGALQVTVSASPVFIHVRWAPDVYDSVREESELRYGLSQGELLEGRTWGYTLSDLSRANVRALVGDAVIEDTDGIERGTGRISPSAPRLSSPPTSHPLRSARLRGLTVICFWLGLIGLALGLAERSAPGRIATWFVHPDGASPRRPRWTSWLTRLVSDHSVDSLRSLLPRLLNVSADSRGWRVWLGVITVAIFSLCWLIKYLDPVGSYGGLTDDHLFYAARGWQILFGELPSRDFVDHGAPLTFYLAAAAQWILGRSTGSEILMTATALALGVALTARLAAQASGSLILGFLSGLFSIMLGLRLYNYPKVLVYAVAFSVLWTFADRPDWRRRTAVAIVTAVAFLLRHDHGVYVGLGMLVVLLAHEGMSWRDRWRQAAGYGGTVIALIAPYLLYLQVHGGVVQHFVTASAWAVRDMGRSPLHWPSFGAAIGTPVTSPVAWLADAVMANYEAARFYPILVWPIVGLVVLACVRSGGRPDWPHARVKLIAVAVVGLALNVGFLRSPLGGRFGDVAVPQAILLAWLIAVTARAALNGRLGSALSRPAAALVVAVALVVLAWMPGVLVARIPLNMDRAALLDGWPALVERFERVTRNSQGTWPLENWADATDEGVMRLAFYIRDCTRPRDHVFVSQYLPQIAAMAQRPFAGGQADLRDGFFPSEADQRLVIARMSRQSVPIAIVPSEADYDRYRSSSFPLLGRYFDERYRWFGDVSVGDGIVVGILVDRSATPTRRHPLVDAPCFR